MIFFHVINWRTYDARQKRKKNKNKKLESMKDIANNQQMLSVYSGDRGWLSHLSKEQIDSVWDFQLPELLHLYVIFIMEYNRYLKEKEISSTF